MGGSDTTNILHKTMIMNKAAGGCYILVITPGVSCVFGCSWLLPALVGCTCCVLNIIKYSYHFCLSNIDICHQKFINFSTESTKIRKNFRLAAGPLPGVALSGEQPPAARCEGDNKTRKFFSKF